MSVSAHLRIDLAEYECDAGFRPEVLWRNDGFAVLAAFTADA